MSTLLSNQVVHDRRPDAKTSDRHASVSALFEKHASFLIAVAHRLTGSKQDAEDIVQEVFIKAHKKYKELEHHPQPRAWLYKTTYHCVQHTWRRRTRSRAFAEKYKRNKQPESITPETDASGRETKNAVTLCVAQLKPQYREVFVLYELQELSGAEIAELIDIPINTVWSRLSRAREMFKTLWKDS